MLDLKGNVRMQINFNSINGNEYCKGLIKSGVAMYGSIKIISNEILKNHYTILPNNGNDELHYCDECFKKNIFYSEELTKRTKENEWQG